MSEIVLDAEVRKSVGKKSKRIRMSGKVPGIYYSHGEPNVNIEVLALNLKGLVFTAETHVIDLRLDDGTAKKCILRDVQFDPVSDKPVHFDLQGLKENEELNVEVPLVLTGGVPKGVRDGGMLQHIIHKLRIVCFPKYIPEKIEVNVGDLEINSFVHVRDLQVPNVTILDNPDSSVVGILPPTVEKVVEPVTEAPTEAEPEVVGKGKKAEEEEEPAPTKEK
ncbi:MAG: 50S ribosomal protein L25 [Ignavibacteria bacterium]|nr:50S ribosomal protein L25 [Ignavibacteria bacterium]